MWKEIHFQNHRFWVSILMLNFGGVWTPSTSNQLSIFPKNTFHLWNVLPEVTYQRTSQCSLASYLTSKNQKWSSLCGGGGNYDKLTDTKTEAIKCQQTWPLILGRFAQAMHLLKYTLRISRLWGPRWTQPWMAPTPLLPLGDPSFRWFLHFITRNSKQNLVTWLYTG